MTQPESNGLDGNKKLRILFSPVFAIGHVNACIGLAKPFLKRGHRVGFFLDHTFRGQLTKLGFEEFIFESEYNAKHKNAADHLAELLSSNNILGNAEPLTKVKNIMDLFFNGPDVLNSIRQSEQALKKTIQNFNPDVIIVDNTVLWPCIYHSGKPWINVVSTVPLYYLFDHEDLPPAWSGLSINSDKSKWPPFQEQLKRGLYSKKINNLFEELGYPRYPNDICQPQTQSLNVYAFPEEYNYDKIRKLDKWFNVEVFNKNEQQETVDLKKLVSEEFFNDNLDGKWSGKWIYVSLGSMGSADLNLMKRILDPLAKTSHKYIVSKGPRHQEYDLPGKNMWGDRFLPQKELLPLMDLVLTHGGNNTITETFAQGKPMIIFPLFADQLDNGQRLHETGWATKLEPYAFTEQELLNAIDRMLNDIDLNSELQVAAERIRKSKNHEKFCQLVEEILEKNETEEVHN